MSQRPVPETGPAFAGREAGHLAVSYLALHPMGFSVPRRLRSGRWALTPPFHPYPFEISNFNLKSQSGGLFSVALSVTGDLGLPVPARAPARVGVARHRALGCSDFPPPARAGSDPPPFQNP